MPPKTLLYIKYETYRTDGITIIRYKNHASSNFRWWFWIVNGRSIRWTRVSTTFPPIYGLCYVILTICSFFWRHQKLWTGTQWLSTTFKIYHLKINISNTNTMIFNHLYINEEYSRKIVTINITSIATTTIFKYYGSNIKCDEQFRTRDAHWYSAT